MKDKENKEIAEELDALSPLLAAQRRKHRRAEQNLPNLEALAEKNWAELAGEEPQKAKRSWYLVLSSALAAAVLLLFFSPLLRSEYEQTQGQHFDIADELQELSREELFAYLEEEAEYLPIEELGQMLGSEQDLEELSSRIWQGYELDEDVDF